jgi:hypothetical protein
LYEIFEKIRNPWFNTATNLNGQPWLNRKEFVPNGLMEIKGQIGLQPAINNIVVHLRQKYKLAS